MDTETAPHASMRPRKQSLNIVPPADVVRLVKLRPEVINLVRNACDLSGGRYEPGDVLMACAGEVEGWKPQLWITGSSGGGEPATLDAVAVTELAVYRTGLKALHVVLVAGRTPKAWLQFEDEFAAWGWRQGCSRIQMVGRKGWARTLPHWRLSAHMLERDIAPATGNGEGEGDE